MKVGDLVKLLTVDGNPIGLVTDVWGEHRDSQCGFVKINGREKQWIFRSSQVEVLNGSR